jgi:hypothetical protein
MPNYRKTSLVKPIIVTTLALIATLQIASAQEKLSRDEALRYSAAVSSDLKRLNGTPIPTDVDTQQPVAVSEEPYGLMVLPQKNLDAAKLSQVASGTIAPVGQLWLLKLTPMRDGQAIDADKLRMVTVSADGDEVTVPQCALGARRTASGSLELLVFGKDKEPVLITPMKAIDAKQSSPLDVSADRQGDSGRVTVKLLGKYQASFDVTELDL